MTTRAVVHVHNTFSFHDIEIDSSSSEDESTTLEIVETDDSGPKTFKTIDEVLRSKLDSKKEAVGAPPAQAVVKNMIMYTARQNVPMYTNPTIEFDTKIAAIPYGEMVMMIEVKGRFHKVVWNDIAGWVLKEDVVDRAAHIQPSFVIGEENQSDDKNTVYIRTMLNDIFGVEGADFPLQAGEYVLYKLWERNHHIEWPETRPRTPGMWHKILRGVPMIHIGVTPKVGAIMEYVHDDAFGHLVHVDAVFPDDTVAVSEANFPDSGKYNERTLTKDEWKELRPVFIQVQ